MEAAERPSVDQYFMDMTHLVKVRGTCPRRQVGAVIAKDKRVLTTGYNGAPRNFPHPIDVGCLRDELQIPRGMVADICPCLHAEQNAIIQAATTGVSIDGADLYVTTQPCTQCSRMVANCGIKRVVFEEEYPDPLAIGILTTAGVQLARWDHEAKKAVPLVRPNTFEQAQDEIRRRFREGKLTPAQPVGTQLPIAGQVPLARVPSRIAAPPSPKPDARGADDADDADQAGDAGGGGSGNGRGGAEPPMPEAGRIRELRDDPQRAELIRKMAREKALKRKQAQEEGGL